MFNKWSSIFHYSEKSFALFVLSVLVSLASVVVTYYTIKDMEVVIPACPTVYECPQLIVPDDIICGYGKA